MSSFSTPAGTRRYAERFAGPAAAGRRATQGHFREQPGTGLLWSSVGIGTYLGDPDSRTDAAYTEAVVAAVTSGVNVIDSAINYRFQRSERSIGVALAKLAAAGYQREELILCTKGGYLTPDGEMPADPREYFFREYIEKGVIQVEDVAAGCHSIAPRYLEDQLGRSLRNLGVDCVDVYYLHNPETQLGEVSREEFRKRLRAAFEFLESAVAAGKIRVYGMATWKGFRGSERAQDSISLEDTVGLAREVAGDEHHFRVVQLPYNLQMSEALTAANQAVKGKRLAMVEAAQELGITLVASASLLQGRLARNLPRILGDVLGLDTDHERALQFARSTPGITTALVGMSRVEHVWENLKLVGVQPAPVEQLMKLFDRSV